MAAAYQANGTIRPCTFSTAVLQSALKQIGPDSNQYAPDFGDAWTNLAWARFQNGDAAAACVAAEEAAKHRPSNNSMGDLTAVRNVAQCK